MRNAVVLVVPVFLKFAFEVNVDSKFRLCNEPYGTAGEPVVRKLGLPAVFKLLLEDSVLIADRVTHSRVSGCSESVQIASGKTSETAVSETCVRLVVIYFIEIYFVIFEHITDILSYAQVVDIGFEGTSHKEFH